MYKIQPQTLFTGKFLRYLTECYSTNDIAVEIIQQKEAFEGSIVVTSNQLSGRGQRGNRWEANPGQNVTFSVIFRPNFLAIDRQFSLNMAVALAIVDFLGKWTIGEKVSIKWPNDIYAGNRKLGGILIENIVQRTLEWSVVGIGLNINQTEFQSPNATSLRQVTQHPDFDLGDCISNLCESLERRYLELKNGRYYEQKQAYLSKLFRLGESHNYLVDNQEIVGQIVGVDGIGRLELLTADGRLRAFGMQEIGYII